MSQIRRRMAEPMNREPWTLNYAIRNTTYDIRESIYELLRTKLSKNYAKQTQFRESSNEHNYLLYKGISKFYPAGGAKKQTQFKPNQSLSCLSRVYRGERTCTELRRSSRMGQFPKCQNERKIGCIHISKKYNVLIRKVLDSQTNFVVKNGLY